MLRQFQKIKRGARCAHFLVVALCVCGTLLTACGGGGGGGGGGGPVMNITPPQNNTFSAGDTISSFPSGVRPEDVDLSNASLSISDDTTTVTFLDGTGSITFSNGTVYTCRSTGGCQIRNRVVTRGTIVGSGGPSQPPSGTAGFAPVNQAAFDTLAVGKRAVTSGSSYIDYVSPGRFRAFDEGTTDTGRYTWQRTETNKGRLTLVSDTNDRCTLTLTFTAATMGTYSYTCPDGDSGSGDWRLVDIPGFSPPAAGFAPADQAAFDALVVGKRNSHSTGYLDFVSPGRFRSFDEGTTYTGTYTWQRTETNKGRLTLSDANYRCTYTLTFTAATVGTHSYTCTDGDSGSGSWRLVDIPASPPPTAGFAPADQAAFDALVVGKRILGPVPAANYYLDFVSPGRFREFEDGITYTGRYTYTNTGPNTARFVTDYDDGDRCTSILTFTSATTGTSTYTCTGDPPSSSSWRLV